MYWIPDFIIACFKIIKFFKAIFWYFTIIIFLFGRYEENDSEAKKHGKNEDENFVLLKHEI